MRMGDGGLQNSAACRQARQAVLEYPKRDFSRYLPYNPPAPIPGVD
jgi:hypothetical protein